MVFPGGLAELVLLTQLQGLMWDLHASAFSKPSKIDAQEKYADIKALFEMGFINYWGLEKPAFSERWVAFSFGYLEEQIIHI